MAAHQAPPSLGFSRQEHWSGLPFPSPMHESEKWKWSRSVVSDSSRPHGLQSALTLCAVLAVTVAHEASRASIFLHIENIRKDKKIRKCCICIDTSRGSSGACSSISNLVNVPGSWLAYQPPISMSSFPILLTVEECFLPNINLDSSSVRNPPVICLYSGQTQTS